MDLYGPSSLGVAGALADGWWVAKISTYAVWANGQHMQEDSITDCPMFTAAALGITQGQKSLTIGLGDLDVALANFNGTGGYAQGNFTYASAGIGLGDLDLVLGNFNSTLNAPPTTPGGFSVSNVTTSETAAQTALGLVWTPP